ncbi:MAG: hypothetical protein KDC73_06840 [Ignavibacteriae bacterium]|nr:hypothetical protein [Ignavibacteriota bacterium]MCB9244657.1 hypothetical protein [Ignavibacteriales bacterium]
MLRISAILLLLVFLQTGCETSSDKVYLPSTMPEDIVVEFNDAMSGKDFHLSLDTSYAVFMVNGETKKVDIDVSREEMTKLFSLLQTNDLSRIDTFKIPIQNLPEESKKPVYDLNVKWGGNTIQKYVSADTRIKQENQMQFDDIVNGILMVAYASLEKQRREITFQLDESLYAGNNFVTVDVNTFFTGDSLYFYSSNDVGKKNELKVRTLDGKNLITLFVNRTNPTPGQAFNVASGNFNIDITQNMKGLKFYLESDSIKWTPVNE